MVKPGYKQTEIGIIPEDWETSKLGDIGQFKNGINKDKDKFGYGVPIIGLMDVFGVNHINSTANSGLVDASPYEQEDYSLKEGDVLFVRSSVKPAGVGLTAVVEQTLQNAVFSGFLLRYRTEKLTVGFKRYAFYASYFRENLIAASTVSANTNINQDSLKQLVLAYPTDEAEQNKIAQAISHIDALILNLEEQLSKKKAIKQGAMQKLLTGKKRLPEFSGEWESIALGKVSSFYNGGTPSKKREDWWTGNIPWISSSDLSESSITSVKISRFISQDAVEHSATRICPKNAVLIVSRVGVGKVAVSPCELCTSQDFTAVVSSRHNPYFLAYMLMPLMKDLAIQAQGTSIKGVTTEDIQKIAIPTPTIDEQNAIVNILANMDSEIEALEQKLAKYRQVKQGMMQQLLTGKIRLV